VVVKEPAITVIGKDGEREIVDVDIIVDEGNQYWLKEVQFKNTATFPMAELRAAFPIGDGDLFNREKIATGLENLRRLYGTKGFVNFSAVPETMIDEAAHSISLTVDLDEGSVFHLGTLTVRGVESEPGAREKLLNAWKSYQGRVYDDRLLPQFLKDIGARAEVKPEQIFETSQDANARVVNVFITLAKPPLF
jgi:outer membrane protein assembly factor BamA